MALYVKTDGPVPEWSKHIKAGEAYPVMSIEAHPEYHWFAEVRGGDRKPITVLGSRCPHLEHDCGVYSLWSICEADGKPICGKTIDQLKSMFEGA